MLGRRLVQKPKHALLALLRSAIDPLNLCSPCTPVFFLVLSPLNLPLLYCSRCLAHQTYVLLALLKSGIGPLWSACTTVLLSMLCPLHLCSPRTIVLGPVDLDEVVLSREDCKIDRDTTVPRVAMVDEIKLTLRVSQPA